MEFNGIKVTLVESINVIFHRRTDGPRNKGIQQVEEGFVDLAWEQLLAPCNLTSLRVEENEYFLTAGHKMLEVWHRKLEAWRRKNDSHAPKPKVYRDDFESSIPDTPEGQQAISDLPYRLASEQGATILAEEIDRRENWLRAQAIWKAQAKADGVYRDYGWAVKRLRNHGSLSEADMADLPYFARCLSNFRAAHGLKPGPTGI